jgi:hypothetical protein
VAQLQLWHQLFEQQTITLEQANASVNGVVDQFADLVQLHYKSGRSDTAFWQHQQLTPLRPGLEYVKNIVNTRWPTHRDLDQGWGSAGYGVFIYPLINYGWIDLGLHQTTAFYRGYGARWRRHCKEIVRSVISQQELVNNLDRIPRLRFSKKFDTIVEPVQLQDLHPFLRS